MSGIFGILRSDGGEVSERDLERMGNTLAHRGPDGRKFVADGAVGLGHCLMRVNNEDLFEAQPLRDREAGLTLVADCRIDNREDLAEAFGLSFADIRDMPDSAFILRAYKKWGDDCAEHLLGDFAFAIWDGRAKRLLLGRDHMGQRYIHYHQAKSFFVFATEIKALWAYPDVPRILSDVEIGRHIVYDRSLRGGATLFEEIAGVQCGMITTVNDKGSVKSRRYWAPHADTVHLGRDEAYYISTYRTILTEAVVCRVRRLIGQPALFLSGGYDSSAIAGLAGPILTRTHRKMVGLSSVLPEGAPPSNDDARPWVELCKRKMPHLDVRYFARIDETILTDLELKLSRGDGVPTESHHIWQALFQKAAGTGARLLMDGHGGDYTLNPRGRGALARFLKTGRLRRFVSEFGPHLRMSGHSLWHTLKRDLIFLLAPLWARNAWAKMRRNFAPLWMDRPIAPDFARSLVATGKIADNHIVGRQRDLAAMRGRILQKLHRLSEFPVPGFSIEAAGWGLDMTRPFHDKRVLEFALAIPEDLYLKGGRNRYLACQALRDIYPIEFQTRPRRTELHEPNVEGMLTSVRPHLKTELNRMANSKTLTKYIDFAKIEFELCEKPRTDRAQVAYAIRAFLTARYMSWFYGQNR